MHLPWFVGPWSAADGTRKSKWVRIAGRAGDAPHKGTTYQPGSKVIWLMEALRHVESEFAFLMDTDAIWLCNATEVIRKRSQLIREANSSENSVVMFAEKGMWPPYQYFHGINLRLNQTAGYPPLSNGSYFRFINSGAALGRPQDLLAMYRCMAERYEEFPHACPAGHSESGKLLYYRESDGYRQPPVDRKNHAQQQRYHGRTLTGSNWGWDQACFHHYYLEQRNGELPAKCPPIVLDRVARCLLHLAGVSDGKKTLRWSSRKDGKSETPRVTLKMTGESPCVLHANGPSKRALKPIWKWWNGQDKGLPPPDL